MRKIDPRVVWKSSLGREPVTVTGCMVAGAVVGPAGFWSGGGGVGAGTLCVLFGRLLRHCAGGEQQASHGSRRGKGTRHFNYSPKAQAADWISANASHYHDFKGEVRIICKSGNCNAMKFANAHDCSLLLEGKWRARLDSNQRPTA